jgi:7,8-dihydroneopterin aldolase/epimerase/oxygenase
MAPEDDEDLDDELEDDDYDEEDREAPQTEVTIEVTGLSLYTHHGVTAAEQEVGQRLVLDLRMEVGECDATVTDMVEDTVDYAKVSERVALVAQQRSYKTLERLCSAIADRLLADFGAEEVWVKATKPEPPIPLPVESVSVEVWRQASE